MLELSSALAQTAVAAKRYFFFAAFFFAPVFFRGRRFGAALGLLFLALIPIFSSTKCTPTN